GLNRPDLFSLIDLDGDLEIIFGEDPDVEEMVWTGPQTPLRDQARAAGVDRTAPWSELEARLAKARRGGRKVRYLPPYRAEITIQLGRLPGLPLEQVAAGASVGFIEAVIAQRSVKSDEEIAEIEAALEICARMHRRVMSLVRPGPRERDLVGAMTEIILAAGSRPSFPLILTTRGHILHNEDQSRELRAGALVINDSGADSPRGYASDITRTLPVGGRFSPRQKEIYEIVLRARETALAAIRPGVRYLDVHWAACETLAGGLKDLGLMKGDPVEATRAGAHALFMPHGVGHMLGLDVHDLENLGEDRVGYSPTLRRSDQFGLRALRLARELEPGFVTTVEPGLYFNPLLIDLWRAENRLSHFLDYEAIDKYRDFTGIRIEDDVLTTNDGARALGPPIPKTVEEVEALTAK
ncbi:MAG: aminopeptidase P family protein, partial [Pseudomonadota bacterium]